MTDNQRAAFELLWKNAGDSWVPPIALVEAQYNRLWAGLRDLPFELFGRGLQEALKRTKYFPTVADVRASFDLDPALKADLIRLETGRAKGDESIAQKIAYLAKKLRGPSDAYSLARILEEISDLHLGDLKATLDDFVRGADFFPTTSQIRDFTVAKGEEREWRHRQALAAAANDDDVPFGIGTASDRWTAVLRRMAQPGGIALYRRTTVCRCGVVVFTEDAEVLEFANGQPHDVCLPATKEQAPRAPHCGFCEDSGWVRLTCTTTSPCSHCRRKGGSREEHHYVTACECRSTNPVYQKHLLATQEHVARRGSRSSLPLAAKRRGRWQLASGGSEHE